MKFTCKSDNEYASFHILPNASVLIKYSSIIGTDYLSKQFFILLNNDGVLDLNFIIPSNRLNVNLKHNIEEGKLHDSIKKSFYVKNINYKIILLDEILRILISKTFGTNIKSEHYEPQMLYGSEATLSFGLNYNSTINDIMKTTLFDICTHPLQNTEPVSVKSIIKNYFNECIDAIHFTNTEDYSNYLTIQHYIGNVLIPMTSKQKRDNSLQHKKIKRFISMFNDEMLCDLSKIFLNSQINDKCDHLMDKIQKIKKLNIRRTKIKIPCSNIPIVVDSNGRLIYELYGKSFDIPIVIKNHHQNEMVPFIRFVNSVISLGKFDEINSACEKLILLNC